MGEGGGELGFAAEAGEVLLADAQHHFHGDRPAEIDLLGFPDFAHAAFTEFLLEDELAEEVALGGAGAVDGGDGRTGALADGGVGLDGDADVGEGIGHVGEDFLFVEEAAVAEDVGEGLGLGLFEGGPELVGGEEAASDDGAENGGVRQRHE